MALASIIIAALIGYAVGYLLAERQKRRATVTPKPHMLHVHDWVRGWAYIGRGASRERTDVCRTCFAERRLVKEYNSCVWRRDPDEEIAEARALAARDAKGGAA